MLDDAAAPGYDAELAGLPAAVLAFATTSHPPVRAVSWSLAKLVATPIAALVAVTSLGGGVALAAATGNLPDAVQDLATKLGAPAPDRAADDDAADDGDDAAADLDARRPDRGVTPTRIGQGRCTAVTMGGKDTNGRALQSAPLAAAVAEGCPGSAAPGSRRSGTAKVEGADKAVKPVRPLAPVKPLRAARPGTAPRPAPADKPGTTGGSGTTAPAHKRAGAVKPVKPATADVPDAAPATGSPGGIGPEPSAPARQAPRAPVQQSRSDDPRA